MALIRTNALVLRNLRMGDTSRIVTILTRDFGKFGAVAKGVREPKSRFGASLELLSVSSLILYFRPGRDLQLVSEGALEREFRGLFSPVDRYAHACALVEFLDRTLELQDKHGARFAPAPLLEELARDNMTFYEAFGG